MGKMRCWGLDRSGDYPGGLAQSRMKEFFKQDGSLRRAFQIDSKKKTADSGDSRNLPWLAAFASKLEVEMQSVLDLTGVADQTARGAESRL